jgi:putative ABC transport system ATP-binding protein
VEGVLRLLRELASGERIVVVATHDTRIMPFAERVVGLLEVVCESADGAEQLLKIAALGEYVGEIGPLFRMPRSASVCARTGAIVTGYTVGAFHRLLETYAEGGLIEHHEIDIEQENAEHDHRDLGGAALLAGHR